MPDIESRQQRLTAEAQFFQNPWSETTQKERDRILLASVVGIVMAGAGIFPKEITALGLKVEDIHQRALLILWAVVVAYLTITLALHAYSDFMRSYWGELYKMESRVFPHDQPAQQIAVETQRVRYRLRSVHIFRIFVDILIPVASAITTFVWLLWRCFRV